MFLKLLKLFLLVFVLSVCFFYGKEVSFSQQWVLYEALRNTSAVIFGVMGAWLAIVYPGTLSDILKSEKNADELFNRLIKPIIYSTAILIAVLFVGIITPILKQIPFFISHYKFLRALSYSSLGGLTCLQSWTLIIALVPADAIKKDLHNRNKTNVKNQILSRTQTKD